MKNFAYRFLIATLSFSFAVAAVAQQATFADVAAGTAAPSSLKLAELTPDYKAMKLRSAGETAPGMMGGLGGLMMIAGMGGGQNPGNVLPAFFQLSGLSEDVWTKGQTLNLAGHDFLITYKLNAGIDPSAMNGPSPRMVANLTLNLVRTDTVISVAPDGAMTPDLLRKTLKASNVTFDMAPMHMMDVSSDDATEAAILFPVFAQAKAAAQHTAALSNAKQIALASLMYSNDYDDVLPYVQSTAQFQKVTYPYSRSNEIWKTSNPKGGGFRFAMNLAGVNMVTIDNPSDTPLVYEVNAWPDGRRAVAFTDGHAKRVSAQEWVAIESRLSRKFPKAANKPIKFG